MILFQLSIAKKLCASFYLDCFMLPLSNLDHLIVWSHLSVGKKLFASIYLYCSTLPWPNLYCCPFYFDYRWQERCMHHFFWLFHIFHVKLGPVSLWFSCQWQESCMHQYIWTAQHCLCETWTFDHLISNSHWQPLISQVGWWIKLNFGIWHIPATMETILWVLERVT